MVTVIATLKSNPSIKASYDVTVKLGSYFITVTYTTRLTPILRLRMFGDNDTWKSLHGGFREYRVNALSFGDKFDETKIEDMFLGGHGNSLDRPIILPDIITSIGNNFITGSYMPNLISFNQPITLPKNLESIGDLFLANHDKFNQELVIPDSVTSIGDYFIGVRTLITGGRYFKDIIEFNQPIKLPKNLKKIGSYFLSGWARRGAYSYDGFGTTIYRFNQPLTIPDGVESIGDYFLGINEESAQGRKHREFNQELVMPDSVTSIGDGFLRDCRSYNYPLEIPGSVTRIGHGFMQNCNEMVSILTYNTEALPPADPGASPTLPDIYRVSYYSLSTTVNDAPMHTEGIPISGSSADALRGRLRNRNVIPFRNTYIV